MQVRSHTEVSWFQRLVQRFAWSRMGRWLGANYLHHLDRLVLQLTRGKHTLSSVATGVPIVMLTTTGAKTGRARTVPLIGLPDQDRMILVASSWGRENHPGWYYNLLRNPHASLATPQGRLDYIAHMASEAEAQVYWEKAIAIYPGYRVYRQIASQRQIGLFILEPDDHSSTPVE